MKAQYDNLGSVEDGMWKAGDTFRITHALIEYYNRIKTDLLFASAFASRDC